jgi:hypothetical protein
LSRQAAFDYASSADFRAPLRLAAIFFAMIISIGHYARCRHIGHALSLRRQRH